MPRKKTEQPEVTAAIEETNGVQTEEMAEFLNPETIPAKPQKSTEPAILPEESKPETPEGKLTDEPDSSSEAVPEQKAIIQPEKESQSEQPKESEPAKKRRSPGKKKDPNAEPASEPESPLLPVEPVISEEIAPAKPKRPAPGRRKSEPSILTIASGDEVDSLDAQEETAWHEIRNAYRTRRILTGTLGGIEPTDAGKPIAIVNYNEYRVVIPLSEMMINLNEGKNNYGEMQLRKSKILGNMIGSEIDFVVKGIESKSRSIVASRKDAMMRKRKLFYFDTDSQGMYRIYEGRIVQARVIAVAEKVIRVEAFGVECPIMARDLSYNWLGDAHEYYNVGDEILIRVQQVNRESLDSLSIRADVKSISGETDRDNLKKCRIQGKYAGTVTDIHRGVVFVRLNIGVNAVAHSCYDSRMPGKKDEVSFAVTHLDEDRNVAVGIITRIMRRKV